MFRKVILILSLIFVSSTASAAYPRPVGFVNDFANVIDPQSKPQLESVLKSFESASGDEVSVATLPTLDGRTIDDVAVDLYKTWGIGKKGKDNGVLFLIAPNERKMRIEVGYGLEGVLNDALTGRIMDEYVLPKFHTGNISDGIVSGTMAIVKTIADKEQILFDINAASLNQNTDIQPQKKKSSPISVAFKILFFIFMAILFIRHPWLFLLLLSSSGRGGGGGGFGGGFGGFGGGLSGGGGASRGW